MVDSYPECGLLLRGNRMDESAFRASVDLQGGVWAPGADPFGLDALDPSAGTASLAINARTTLGSEDWTLEAWCKPTSFSATGNYIVEIGAFGTTAYGSVSVSTDSTRRLNVLISPAGGSWVNTTTFSGGVLALNEWSFLEVTRRGSSIIGAINGVDVIGYAIGSSLTPPPAATGLIRLGGSPYQANLRSFNGLLGPIRFTQGLALRGAGGPLPIPTEVFPVLPPTGPRSGPIRVNVAASATVPAFSGKNSRSLLARDVEFGGVGRVWGTTKIKGLSGRVPTKARVVLMHQRSKLPARETWSDPITGFFAFDGIDANQQWITYAEDVAGNFLPVAANRLAPKVP